MVTCRNRLDVAGRRSPGSGLLLVMLVGLLAVAVAALMLGVGRVYSLRSEVRP